MNKMVSIIIVLVVILGGVYFVSKNKSSMEQTNNMTTPLQNEIKVTPISHASVVLDWGGKIIYTDPVGGAAAYVGQPAPDLILLTDIHGDHLNAETLDAVVGDGTVVIAPQAVADQIISTLPGGTLIIMNNGEKSVQHGFTIEAIPMYNLPETADSRHTKGRGNGYVLEGAGKRVYFSGDTADIKEMRRLRNIDMAFVTMNMPYTMTVEAAASAVLEFKPKVVIPYHYRGQDGLSDTSKFRKIVNASNPNITVDLIDFYPTPSTE